MNDKNSSRTPPEILLCRCADCSLNNRAKCNSSELRSVLDTIFDDAELARASGLYCRGTAPAPAPDDVVPGECRCLECTLLPGGATRYCGAPGS